MVAVKQGVVTEIKASADYCRARGYQDEILQICQKQNVIVRLDTGMGKTHIAIMLMRWLTSLPKVDDEHRLVVFLAPTVALVDQQAGVICRHTPLRVATYTGDTDGVDFWNTEKWQLEFSRSDCVVMTPQIWLNVLLHAYWPLSKVLLMVLDECHHCQKNHSYNQIMQEYHRYKAEQLPDETLPHILGLTASPLFNPKDAKREVAVLEANLDAKVVTARESVEEVKGCAMKPRELEHYFSLDGIIPIRLDFEDELEDLEIWEYIEKEDKIQRRIGSTKHVLGSLACRAYICSWLESLCDPVATKESLQAIRASGRIPDIQKLQKSMQQRLDKQSYYFLGDVSDKVKELVKLLSNYKDKPDFHAIVFVEQRHHAQALSMLLSKSQTLQAFIRPEHFVGHGSGGSERLASEGMQAKVQRRAVERFRKGETNLLVATNVAEEGLDFQACNLIVRFDGMATYKGYIQSRGRARKKGSDFIVMIERDSVWETKLRGFQRTEMQLDQQFQQHNHDSEPEEADLTHTPRFVVQETGATLTYGSAIALLDEVCSLIPSDAYSPPAKPRYKLGHSALGYYYKVFLPMMPRLPPTEREVIGAEMSTKTVSKKAVAFVVCCTLYHYGILNDHLLPIREGRGDNARDADDELVDRAVLPLHIESETYNPYGNMWLDATADIWLNVVQYTTSEGGYAKFGLLCARPLNAEVPLEMHEPGCSTQVQVSAATTLRFQSAESRLQCLQQLVRFTKWILSQSVNRKQARGNLLYLLAPLKISRSASAQIDWEAANQPLLDIENVDDVKSGDMIIAPWQFMRKHVFTVHDVRRDLNSLNMPRITGLTRSGHMFDRADTFGGTLIKLLDYEGVDITDLDFNEAILHLRPWFRVRNNLNPLKADGRARRTNADGSVIQTSLAEAAGAVSLEEATAALEPWEKPEWKWRAYKTQQYERDDEKDDLADPADANNSETLKPLLPGQTIVDQREMTNAFALPWSLCKRSRIPIAVWNGFSWLPSLTRAIHDQMQAQAAVKALGLPSLQYSLISQALTVPMCCTGKDYQTLETIGDSALKLAVTVYVYNRYTAKDEGGLSMRRMNSIDNQHLRMKATKLGLTRFIRTEFMKARTWVPATDANMDLRPDGISSSTVVPRRALSDCMEALLGAAYLSGGMAAVLQTGEALGLCFGGSVAWSERYQIGQQMPVMPVGPALRTLEEQLGYTFKHGQLLQQALTHRSFSNAQTHCQEREEFLGDAVLDNYIIDRLSRRFPTATPSHLTRLRATLVSNSALGYLALRFMGLHRYILHSTPLLTTHFERALSEANSLDHDDFVHEIWTFDPPKPAADALEGIIGSLFIDCGWQTEPVFKVLDKIFEDLFRLLPHKEAAPRDPTTRLRQFLQAKRCRSLDIKAERRLDMEQAAVVTILWHDLEISKVPNHSQASAKQLAAKAALKTMMSMFDNGEMQGICDCPRDVDESVQALKEWKKAQELRLKALSLLTAHTRPEDVPLDPAIEADLGRDDDLERDVHELLVESAMKENFGYDPDLPERAEPTYGEETPQGVPLGAAGGADSGFVTRQASLVVADPSAADQSSISQTHSTQTTKSAAPGSPSSLKRARDLIYFTDDED